MNHILNPARPLRRVSTSAGGRARRFEGKVVLITGTGGGQGRAAALRIAAEAPWSWARTSRPTATPRR